MNTKPLAVIVVTLLALLSAGPGIAAEKTTKPTKSTKSTKPAPSPTPTAQPQQASTAPINAIAQAMAKQGVSRCVPRASQLTGFLTANAQAGVMMFVDPNGPDQRLSSVSMEVRGQNKSLNYASATFMPSEASIDCGGLYEAVTYWNNKCDDVGARAFGNFKRAAPLHQSIATLAGGPTVRVFLIPAGAGCVSVKREIVY